METHADAVLTRVRSLVRDDVLDALVVSSRASRQFVVDLTVTQTVAFTVAYAAGTGHLSNDVERVAPGVDLEAIAASRLHAATGDAARLLRHWADSHPDYRARLRAHDCVEPAAPVGTQFRCDPCQGSGRIVCDHCDGKKRVPCPAPYCHGKGQWVCTDCNGYGQRRCSPCGGSGSVQRYESVWGRDQSGNSVSTTQLVSGTCSGCGGAGSTRCGECSSGWVYCGRCHRSGIVDCPKCYASGAIDCPGCAATGVLHRTASIRCDVHHGAQFGVGDADEEDHEAVRRIGFDALGELGAMARRDVHVSPDALVMHYRSHVPVETVDVTRGAAHTQIRGFGADHRVVDYHGIVEQLLTPDLLAFEGAVGQRFRAAAGGGGLAAAARQFLASEVHALIAARHGRAGKRGHSSPDDGATALVESNLVSATYVQRLESAVGKALPHLYGSFLLPGTLAVLGGLVVIGALLAYEPFSPWNAPVKLLALTTVAALAWAAWEIVAAQRLRGVLGPELYDRLWPRFQRMRRVSWGVTVGVLAMVALTAAARIALAIKDSGLRHAFALTAARSASMADVLRDSLALDLAQADLPSVRAALQRGGATIAYDRAFDGGRTHQIRTDGARGYPTPDVAQVLYTFSQDGRLVLVVMLRVADGIDPVFEGRVEAVGRLVPRMKRLPRFAFFHGPSIDVTLKAGTAMGMNEIYEPARPVR